MIYFLDKKINKLCRNRDFKWWVKTQFGTVLTQLGILDQSSEIWFPQNLNAQAHWRISRIEPLNGNLRNIQVKCVKTFIPFIPNIDFYSITEKSATFGGAKCLFCEDSDWIILGNISVT